MAAIEISEERFTFYNGNEILDSIEEGKDLFEGFDKSHQRLKRLYKT